MNTASKSVFASLAVTVLVVVTMMAYPRVRRHFHTQYIRSHYPLSFDNAKIVGLALRLYAEDHGGQIPPTLEAVVPTYLEDAKLLDHMSLLTPNVRFSDLAPSTVILQHSRPERDDGFTSSTRMAVIMSFSDKACRCAEPVMTFAYACRTGPKARQQASPGQRPGLCVERVKP